MDHTARTIQNIRITYTRAFWDLPQPLQNHVQNRTRPPRGLSLPARVANPPRGLCAGTSVAHNLRPHIAHSSSRFDQADAKMHFKAEGVIRRCLATILESRETNSANKQSLAIQQTQSDLAMICLQTYKISKPQILCRLLSND